MGERPAVPPMKRAGWLVGVVLGVAATGCVERRFVIESVPPGAQVFRNGQPIGFTPVDDAFVYYGKYQFTLVKDGCETLHVVQDVPAPWYQIPPIDFISENLVPFKIRDRRPFVYQLQPRRAVSSGEVLQRAQDLRGQGQLIGEPRPAPPPAPTPPAP